MIPPTETCLPREALSLWLTASGAEEGESRAHRWWRTVGGREGVSMTQPGQAPWEGAVVRARGAGRCPGLPLCRWPGCLSPRRPAPAWPRLRPGDAVTVSAGQSAWEGPAGRDSVKTTGVARLG